MKFDGTAKQAIQQIRNKDYSLPFERQGRKIIKIGANVSNETRNIEEWIIKITTNNFVQSFSFNINLQVLKYDNNMKIAVAGTGYVGLSMAILLAAAKENRFVWNGM